MRRKFDERERLKEVNSYEIEDTLPEKVYDDIAFLASALCGTPIALVTLMYKDRQWFKAVVGTDLKENKRELSFCTHAIAGEENVMVVEDANEDVRFMHNPLVQGGPRIVFYAGASIVDKNGHGLGTVCVYDVVKKSLTKEQIKGLKILSEQVMGLLELRKQNLRLENDIHEHVDARKRVETSEAKFRNLILQAPVLITTFKGPSFIIETINEKALELWGKTYEEVINKPLFEVFHELALGLRGILTNVYTTGETFIASKIEVQLQRRGKSDTAYFDSVYKPLRDLDNKIYGIIVIGTEVTEAVNARRLIEESEKALQRQLQLTETITNTASACLFMINNAGQVIFMNPAAEKVTGHTPQEAIGKQMHELVHHSYPDGSHYPESKCPLVGTYKNGDPSPAHEDVFFRKDGSPFPVLITGTPIHGPYGTVATVVEFRDITEEKQSKDSVAESEERFRSLANSIQNLAWMASADGKVFWYNQRWFDYTGTTLQEMQGWGWKKVHHPDHIKEVTTFLKEAWKKGESFELTFPLRGVDGTYRWFLTRADVVRNAQGKVIRWIGTNTDIDDQKRALEQKDEFMSVASHELKTPVTSVKAYTQVLHARFKKAEDVSSAELVSKMDRQLDKLTDLISDLLDATKIEAGKFLFTAELFDFNTLVHEIIEEIQRTTEKHTISLQLAVTASISGDRDRIGQVLTNLLTNAIKYSPRAHTIVVSTSFDMHDITLRVQDYGLGIAKEKQERVFERFYRVEGAKENTFPGLGLGLYISSEIIKRQGGKIWVESVVGKGSTFCFSLPVKENKDGGIKKPMRKNNTKRS